jgi:hypothetical protein
LGSAKLAHHDAKRHFVTDMRVYKVFLLRLLIPVVIHGGFYHLLCCNVQVYTRLNGWLLFCFMESIWTPSSVWAVMWHFGEALVETGAVVDELLRRR